MPNPNPNYTNKILEWNLGIKDWRNCGASKCSKHVSLRKLCIASTFIIIDNRFIVNEIDSKNNGLVKLPDVVSLKQNVSAPGLCTPPLKFLGEDDQETTRKLRGEETMTTKTKVSGCDDENASSLQLASQIPRRRRRRIMAGYDDEGHGRTRRRRWWCSGRNYNSDAPYFKVVYMLIYLKSIKSLRLELSRNQSSLCLYNYGYLSK
ncbi:hypothetical protein YC2023_107099 [Brassica napus]